MAKKFGCIQWSPGTPKDEIPGVPTCAGCLTKLVSVPSRLGLVDDCPTCHGDGNLLAEFKSKVKAYEKKGLHPAHAANKVRKEIREANNG